MIKENLDVFLATFGSDVVFNGKRYQGILDAPTNVMGGGMVLSNEYLLTVKTADLGAAGYGDSIKVAGSNYQVREARQIDDAAFTEILLTKV